LDTSHISLNFDDYDGFDNGLNWEWVNPVGPFVGDEYPFGSYMM